MLRVYVRPSVRPSVRRKFSQKAVEIERRHPGGDVGPMKDKSLPVSFFLSFAEVSGFSSVWTVVYI